MRLAPYWLTVSSPDELRDGKMSVAVDTEGRAVEAGVSRVGLGEGAAHGRDSMTAALPNMVWLGLPTVQAGASKHAFGPTVTVTPFEGAHMLISVSIWPHEALLALLLA
jgi:hypothetical protein